MRCAFCVKLLRTFHLVHGSYSVRTNLWCDLHSFQLCVEHPHVKLLNSNSRVNRWRHFQRVNWCKQNLPTICWNQAKHCTSQLVNRHRQIQEILCRHMSGTSQRTVLTLGVYKISLKGLQGQCNSEVWLKHCRTMPIYLLLYSRQPYNVKSHILQWTILNAQITQNSRNPPAYLRQKWI